jgi:hypothetical protein
MAEWYPQSPPGPPPGRAAAHRHCAGFGDIGWVEGRGRFQAIASTSFPECPHPFSGGLCRLAVCCCTRTSSLRQRGHASRMPSEPKCANACSARKTARPPLPFLQQRFEFHLQLRRSNGQRRFRVEPNHPFDQGGFERMIVDQAITRDTEGGIEGKSDY